ncbi:MAG: hypothetical protein JXA54_16505 [Candidatus Heimdallarchaeota archaeon]|nr:hypothetical protein [Candidatus Heimdallarchaeota archaeon]
MNTNDEGNEPPPIEHIDSFDEYSELEDWDLPAVLTEEDECPEILIDVEPEEAFEALFTNIHLSTIISLVLGIVVGVLFYVLYRFIPHTITNQIIIIILGFCSGVLLVFGASEIIILGVKGIQDKLNWSPYLSGILQAIGAALAELVVVIFLLISAKRIGSTGIEEDIIHANNLSTTAITLILATVIINIFFLGISMMIISKDDPFSLPKELTLFEANLVLGMMVFSFVIMLYGIYFEFSDIGTDIVDASSFNRGFEIIIGLALILVYFIFLFFLVQRFGKRSSTPQTLISEFFPDEDDVIIEELSTTKFIQSRLFQNRIVVKKEKNDIPCKEDKNTKKGKKQKRKKSENGSKFNLEKETALATLRRFPWYIIIILFVIGAGGIVWGGQILSHSIEDGITIFKDVPILVYSVVVGLISSSPELVVTFRGVFKKDKEYKEVGLVHQVSAINQTFFILFGVPFVLSGILNIGIPIALEITIVMGGIFIMSAAVIMMIMDDGKFDLLEGAVITILAIVSLLALTLIGGFSTESESTQMALQLAKIHQIL